MGSDVIVVHRLLKNDAVERLGVSAYALFTQATFDATGLEPTALGMARLTQTYEHVGEVATWVLDLERRWAEEDARQRVFVTPDQAWTGFSVETAAPPALAWEVVTSPARRPVWQHGVTEVALVGATGNRRGVGAANHCRHGAEAGVIEEILDWRPFDYLSDRGTHATPDGPARMLETIEFEPTATGTTIHFRYAPPKTARERAAVAALEPIYRQVFAGWASNLAALLAVEGAARGAEAATEPEVPSPSRTGILGGLDGAAGASAGG
jgi:uncharacterized protein YndB with AHSA1/START domain